MDRWTKIECLSLFKFKPTTVGFSSDVIRFGTGNVISLIAVLDSIHVITGYCILCNKRIIRGCDDCQSVIDNIIRDHKVFVYRTKLDKSAIKIEFPFYGHTSGGFVAVIGSDIQTYTIRSNISSFNIGAYITCGNHINDVCSRCNGNMIRDGCRCLYTRFHRQFIDKMYLIYLTLRANLIGDICDRLFMDIYLAYAILLDFY